jgi:hypothetical protein
MNMIVICLLVFPTPFWVPGHANEFEDEMLNVFGTILLKRPFLIGSRTGSVFSGLHTPSILSRKLSFHYSFFMSSLYCFLKIL